MSAEAKEKTKVEKVMDDKLTPVWDCLDDFMRELRGLEETQETLKKDFEQSQDSIKKEYEALKGKVRKIEKHLKIMNSE